jgi:hypothetical protein
VRLDRLAGDSGTVPVAISDDAAATPDVGTTGILGLAVAITVRSATTPVPTAMDMLAWSDVGMASCGA